MAGWQLNEQGAELVAKPADFGDEVRQGLRHIDEASHVGDLPGQFHGKLEGVGDAHRS